jgi:hypothetical protein
VELPSDLVPLPTQPWDERPDSLPLTIEEARTALWLESGSIPKAAIRLKVTANRLRRYIQSSPRLTADQNEAREQLADRAEEIVKEALDDPVDAGRRDSMAKYVLASIGRPRGYGTGPGKLSVNSNGGPIIITWGDGTDIEDPLSPDSEKQRNGDDAKIINGEVEDAA